MKTKICSIKQYRSDFLFQTPDARSQAPSFGKRSDFPEFISYRGLFSIFHRYRVASLTSLEDHSFHHQQYNLSKSLLTPCYKGFAIFVQTKLKKFLMVLLYITLEIFNLKPMTSHVKNCTIT